MSNFESIIKILQQDLEIIHTHRGLGYGLCAS